MKKNISLKIRSAIVISEIVLSFLLVFSGSLLLKEDFAYAADTTPPSISAITVSPSDTTAMISWWTDEGANSQINFSTSNPSSSASYASSSPVQADVVNNHSLTLTNLVPATLYHFRIVSTDTSGNVAYSSDQTFTTSGGNLSASTGSTTSASSGPALSLSSASGAPGASFILTGSGFAPGEVVTVQFGSAVITSASANTAGGFSLLLAVPNGEAVGNMAISVKGNSSNKTATSMFNVLGVSAPTQTTSSTDFTTLQNQLNELRDLVLKLQQQLNAFIASSGQPSQASSGQSTGAIPSGESLYTGTAGSINDSSFKLTASDGTIYTVDVGPTTTLWNKARGEVSFSDIKEGDSVRLDAPQPADTTLTPSFLRDISI